MKIDQSAQAIAADLYHDAALALESVEALLGFVPDGNSRSKTCVIVDAEVDATEALAEYLVARGIQVWTTPSGEEALRVIRQVYPELVLVDS